jgi:hypothetical protein
MEEHRQSTAGKSLNIWWLVIRQHNSLLADDCRLICGSGMKKARLM